LRAERAERSLSIIRSSRLWPLVTSLYRLKHAAWNQPIASLKIYRSKRGNHGLGELAEIFQQVYRDNSWQSSESRSGPGSTLERTEVLRRELPVVLTRLGVRTLIDAPCGDCNWRQHVELELDTYIGLDIVPALIEENRRRYRHLNWQFKVADLIEDPLPAADAVLCRDALIHLSLADIGRALSNIRRSGAKYLLATSHEAINVNTDIATGGWRSVNLMLAPFNLPPPLARIVENPQTGKILGVWSLAGL
jgi:hypothetical protein